MAENEVTTRFKADISDLKKGITDARRNIRLANSEFKQASAGMKNWEMSSNGLTAKLEQLGKTLENQKKILANLKTEYEDICREQGANSAAAQNLAIKINNQQAAINGTEREMSEYEASLEDVRKAEEMTAKNGKSVEENLKEIAKAADEAGNDTEKAANGGFTVLKGVLANLAANAITAAVQGLKKLGAEAIDIGKQAVTAYAEYEQLAGGVETLFGAGGQGIEDYAKSVGKSVDEVKGEYAKLMTAQDSVIKNANNAFKTAGLSANEYMETVTSFSASLIAALDGDTVAAAGAADRAITDMSDNANKMGTDMQSIQNAYQGFAKQNYTMLDNLKLGYGGTKAEMERLLTDAEKLTGKKFDLENFADITEAIHAVQTEMGITGTTAKEASQTIEGSVNSVKAAWKNMLAGLAAGDEMDMSQLTANLIDSVVTAGENLIPRIKTVIESVSQQLPTMLGSLLPMVMQSGSEIITTLAQSLLQSAPMLLQTGIDLLLELVHGITKGLPKAVPQIVDAVIQITEIILDNLDKLIDAGVEIIMALIDGMIEAEPEFLEKMPELLEKLAAAILSGAAKLGEAMLQLTKVMLENFVSKIPEYAKAGKEILRVLRDALLSDLAGQVDVGLRLVQGIWKGISSGIELLNQKLSILVGELVAKVKEWFDSIVLIATVKVPEFVSSVVNKLKVLPDKIWVWFIRSIAKVQNFFSAIISEGLEKGANFVSGMVSAVKNLPGKVEDLLSKTLAKVVQFAKNLAEKGLEAGKGLLEKVSDGVKNLPHKMVEIGSEIVTGLWNGISDKFGWLTDKIKGFATNVTKKLKDFFGIKSPSRVMRDQVGKYLALGIAKGISDNQEAVSKAMDAIKQNLTSSVNLDFSAAKNRIAAAGTSGHASQQGNIQSSTSTYTFNQYNSSPKSLSRLEIYRQTHNILNYAKGV